MNRIHHSLSLVAVGLLGTGCWPLRITSSPGASGIVVDAQTHAAIGGAQAVVCRSSIWGPSPQSVAEALTNARPPRVVTRADGRFSIRPEHRWIIYFPEPAVPPAAGQLVVRRQGYEPVLLPVESDPKWAGGTSRFLTGDITNLASFAAKLKTPSEPVSAWLTERFSESARTALAHYPESGLAGGTLQSILVKELNSVIAGPLIYETNRFRGVTLSPVSLGLMEHDRALSAMNLDEQTYRKLYRGATTPAAVRAYLNRKLLEDAYPGDLSGKQGRGYYRNVGGVLLTPMEK
jgi:hypothetical protein